MSAGPAGATAALQRLAAAVPTAPAATARARGAPAPGSAPRPAPDTPPVEKGQRAASPRPRPAHGRAGNDAAPQRAWIAFGGDATGLPWLRLLRPGFRHCFAAVQDADGWMVLDPLCGRLVVARLEVPAGFDLPRFYRRAGLVVLGPFVPTPPRARALPPLLPLTCVGLCRAVLGADAPAALTPHGLYRALRRWDRPAGDQENCLDTLKRTR